MSTFWKKANQEVLTKADVYALAEELGVHLSEHGGTGQGVIGALAGVGLRLSGNDGRFKGRHQIVTEEGIATVQDILAQTNIDVVQTQDGFRLAVGELVRLGEKVKSVFLDGKNVLLVMPTKADEEIRWQLYPGTVLKEY